MHALFGSVRAAYHLWYLYTYVPLLLLLGVTVLVVRRRDTPRRALLLLVAFAVAPAFAGDARTLTGLPLPEWEWSVSLSSLGYAVAGGALLAAWRYGPRPLWLAGAVVALAALVLYQLTVRHPAAYGSVTVAALTFAVLGAGRGARSAGAGAGAGAAGAAVGRVVRDVPGASAVGAAAGQARGRVAAARLLGARGARRDGVGRGRGGLRRERSVGQSGTAQMARLTPGRGLPGTGRAVRRLGP